MPPVTNSPRLKADFIFDSRGDPTFVADEEKKHYYIKFEVENVPPDVYAATFELHPTYYDPVRTIFPDSNGHIELATTSYGDYDLKVRLRTKEGREVPVTDSLANMLQRNRAAMPSNPTIDSAIADISAL
jgi:hypothetical protein